jgi:hypothetical protein
LRLEQVALRISDLAKCRLPIADFFMALQAHLLQPVNDLEGSLNRQLAIGNDQTSISHAL